ncbi:hypothetical protein, partial [Stenotrophomonas sp.]
PGAASGPAPSRLLQLMDAAHTLTALANEADVGAHRCQDAPHPRRAELLKVRDIVLAEVEAQMTPETFVIWSDMYVRP